MRLSDHGLGQVSVECCEKSSENIVGKIHGLNLSLWCTKEATHVNQIRVYNSEFIWCAISPADVLKLNFPEYSTHQHRRMATPHG